VDNFQEPRAAPQRYDASLNPQILLKSQFFNGHKILCREVPGSGKTIQAAYHYGLAYFGHSITPVLIRDDIKESPHFFVAMLNSKLTSWYANHVCPNFSKDVFPKLNPGDIKKLPIPPATPEDKSRLTALAEACAEATRKQDAAALATLESEINRIVYRLFALTPAEIALIESSLNP
jgi:hypothetical protein